MKTLLSFITVAMLGLMLTGCYTKSCGCPSGHCDMKDTQSK